MNAEDRETLAQWIGGYWHDRPESDATIVKEVVANEEPAYVNTTMRIIQQFLDSTESRESKAAFIREKAWVHFAEGTDAPLRWLSHVQELLEMYGKESE